MPVVLVGLVHAVVFVKGIEEGTVAQDTWPDHIGRPDDKLTKKSTNTKAKGLRPKGKEDVEPCWGSLAIENTLCEDNIVWICALNSNVSHDGDANMLFDWKWAWVKRPDISKSVEFFGGEESCKSFAQGKAQHLGNKIAQTNGGI